MKLNINVNEIAAQSASSPSRTTLICGKRIVSTETETGRLYLANNGITQPNYIIPQRLPAFSDGVSALNYLKTQGLLVKFGQTNTLELTAPTQVTKMGSLTILQWSIIPFGFDVLVNQNVSGIVIQTQVGGNQSGNIYSVQYATVNSVKVAQIILNNTTGIFDTTGVCVVNGTSDFTIPDPNGTDPICMLVYYYYQMALNQIEQTDGRPDSLTSIIPETSTSITANQTAPIVLLQPNEVSGIYADGSQDLTWDYTINVDGNGNKYINILGTGLLPTTMLGNSQVTQSYTSNDVNTIVNVSGTYNGYRLNPTSTSGGTFIINVTNPVNSFSSVGGNVTITLDGTQNVGEYLDNTDVVSLVHQYEITNATQVTVTYVDIFDVVQKLNQGDQVLNAHYGTAAMSGNISTLPQNASTLPLLNNGNDLFYTYPYIAQFGDVLLNGNTNDTKVGAGCLMAWLAYVLANNDGALSSITNVINPVFPVCSKSAQISYNNIWEDVATKQGWGVCSPYSQGGVVIDTAITNQTFLTNTTIVSPEFQQITTFLSKRWLKQNVTRIYVQTITLPNNQGTRKVSDRLLNDIKNNVISLLNTGQTLGWVMNVALYVDKVDVIRNPADATQILVTIPAQLVPGLTGADVTITLYSASYDFTNSQGA